MRCKFCTCTDKHINRDGLCGPCATLLNKVRLQPEKVDMDAFLVHCKKNYMMGLFVPVAQRHLFKAKWACKKCGTCKEIDQDPHYKNYCVACSDSIRHNREMPLKSKRKERSDKGKSRLR